MHVKTKSATTVLCRSLKYEDLDFNTFSSEELCVRTQPKISPLEVITLNSLDFRSREGCEERERGFTAIKKNPLVPIVPTGLRHYAKTSSQ